MLSEKIEQLLQDQVKKEASSSQTLSSNGLLGRR